MGKMLPPKILRLFLVQVDKGLSIEESLNSFPDYRNEILSYLELIGRLNDLKRIEPGREFTEKVLKRVYIDSKTETIAGDRCESRTVLALSRFRPAFLRPVIIFVSILVFITFSFAGTIYAASDSVPGDTLYTMKRIAEDVQVLITPYSEEGKLYEKLLERRMNEADTLLSAGDTPEIEIIESLVNDIDYTYGKCRQHGCFNTDENLLVYERVQRIKKSYFNEHNAGKYNKNENKSSNSNESEDPNPDYEPDNTQQGYKQQKGSSSKAENNSNGKNEN